MSFTLITFEDRCRIRDLLDEQLERNKALLQITPLASERKVSRLHDQIIRDEALIERLSLD